MELIYRKNSFGNLLIALFLFFSSQSLCAQSDELSSQYLFSSFSKAIIKMKNGEIQSSLMNYNMATEEMVFQQKGQNMAIANPENVDTIFMQGRKFIFNGKSFYELAATGPIVLLVQHTVKLTSKKVQSETANYGSAVESAATNTYTSSSQLYSSLVTNGSIYGLKLQDNVLIVDATVFHVLWKNNDVVVSNKKQFLKIFPEKSTEIDQYIKSNKLYIGKQDDLIKLVNYCNELFK